MSYSNKIEVYESNCPMYLGKEKNFIDYQIEFTKAQTGDGLDLGAGPNGPIAKLFTSCASIDGCDSEKCIYESLPERYSKRFLYFMGGK